MGGSDSVMTYATSYLSNNNTAPNCWHEVEVGVSQTPKICYIALGAVQRANAANYSEALALHYWQFLNLA